MRFGIGKDQGRIVSGEVGWRPAQIGLLGWSEAGVKGRSATSARWKHVKECLCLYLNEKYGMACNTADGAKVLRGD